jgi:hypothetical protein
MTASGLTGLKELSSPAVRSAAGYVKRFIMRVLLGIILGICLTVGGAYLYDSHNALEAANAPASVQRPMVNWDIVNTKWQHLTERARSEWSRVAG